ncbi:MAG: OmpA family protein [Sulfuricurvum sp.]|nr:OmpA family protein [Sulfuricurvum sp.]
MKDKPSEWVSISDLMAGVMAVVMLLLVVSVVQSSAQRYLQKAEDSKGRVAQEKASMLVVEQMRQAFAKQGVDELISIDTKNLKITLREGVFARGSACISSEVAEALNQVQPQIADYIIRIPKAQIVIEGHTDNKPVANAVTDKKRFCAVYDDNLTLSAARAREARKLILGQLNPSMTRRIVVGGYGDSHPLKGVDPSDGRNRRIEIRFKFAEEGT